MHMNEISLEGRMPVDAYGAGGFRIDGVWQAGSLVLTPDGMHRFEAPLDAEAFGPVLALAEEIDVVLVGQGTEIGPLPGALRAPLERAGVGVEIMSTAAACRTYNLLLAEDRRVAAVLVAI